MLFLSIPGLFCFHAIGIVALAGSHKVREGSSGSGEHIPEVPFESSRENEEPKEVQEMADVADVSPPVRQNTIQDTNESVFKKHIDNHKNATRNLVCAIWRLLNSKGRDSFEGSLEKYRNKLIIRDFCGQLETAYAYLDLSVVFCSDEAPFANEESDDYLEKFKAIMYAEIIVYKAFTSLLIKFIKIFMKDETDKKLLDEIGERARQCMEARRYLPRKFMEVPKGCQMPTSRQSPEWIYDHTPPGRDEGQILPRLDETHRGGNPGSSDVAD
jgi:hypothetical protein